MAKLISNYAKLHPKVIQLHHYIIAALISIMSGFFPHLKWTCFRLEIDFKRLINNFTFAFQVEDIQL